ncbi:MAG TPA: DMT family transporter [Streptosporangiaceae bacterium]|nr:DMT family transporter [Streptosporangiaceae bacterium]
MVVLLGLAAAVLYGGGDFLGGMATRRAHVLTVLMLVETVAVIVAVAVAVVSGGPASLPGLAWGFSAGAIGGLGLIIFYVGLAAGPMSVVAPVSGLVGTVLPIVVALAEGERPGVGVYAGALLCLVAIVLASSASETDDADAPGRARPPRRVGRAIAYGTASGVSFGLFFLLIRNAGQSGEVWPVAAGRIGELAIVLAAAAVLRPGLLRGLDGGVRGGIPLAAASAGVIDVVANLCYVAATRTGAFGLAVVLASLYPGVTVLLARVVLGERLRWIQRAGLGLAAIGILLVTV